MIGWAPAFSLLEIVAQKNACPACPEGNTEVDTDPKERFVSIKVTPSNDRVLCVYASSGYSTREQLARGRFFERLQVKIKHKDFIGAAPIMSCQNSSWIVGMTIYGEGRTKIHLSSPAMIGPLARI